MKKYLIETPNSSFSGKRGGVQFYQGKAEAELDEQTVIDFEDWGYLVEEVKPKVEPKKHTPTKKKD